MKKRVFNIIQIGTKTDFPSYAFDIGIVIIIILNLFITFFSTFEQARPYKSVMDVIELITIIIFAVEYVLRIWTSEYLYPEASKGKAALKFIFSFYGLIDFFTFFPYFLPIFFPMGIVAFRVFRVIRIFRLFRINAQYDAFNVITDVIKEKRNQLISSMSIIFVFMLATSMCMYSVEHTAQPEVFENAFSGIWWATSTLLTVGYGDVYPITTIGKMLAIVISFLGVGLVAIPTGIISAAFVEQYSNAKNGGTVNDNKNNFMTPTLLEGHPWIGMKVKELVLPPQMDLISIFRNGEAVEFKETTRLKENDELVIYLRR